MILFSKSLKIQVDSRNVKKKKNCEKVFRFSDKIIWIRSCKFPQSWTGYMPSAVNLLTNTTTTSSNTRGDISQINFLENDEKWWQKHSHGYLGSIWVAFTCWLSTLVLKRRFLENGLSKICTLSNFGNTLPMTIILFFKKFKIWCRFQKCKKKLRKSFPSFWKNHWRWELKILTILNRIFSVGYQSVNKHH